MRVAVLGNSHLAALRDGWESLRAAHPDVTLDFYGAAQRDLRPLDVTPAGIEPRKAEARASFRQTSGGPERIAFAGLGAVVIVGLAFGFRQALEIYPGHGTWRLSPAPDRVMLPEDVFRAALAARLGATLAAETARAIHAAGGPPVFLMPQPNYADAFPEAPSSPAQGPDQTALRIATSAGDGPGLEALWRAAAADAAAGAGAHLLAIPPTMLTRGCLMEAVWSIGSRPLHTAQGPAHRADDHWHMNAAYGRAVLEHHLPTLRAKARPPPRRPLLQRLLGPRPR